MNSGLPVRVVIADDHPLVRAGVIATLKDPDAYQIVGQAKNNQEVLALVRQHRPDLLILDLQLDDFPPAALIQECLQSLAELKVLVLTSRTEAEDLAPLRNLHIPGFLTKEESPENLLQAVRLVMAGERWFSPPIRQSFQDLRPDPFLPRLSQRERQVLKAMARAKDNQAIADELGLSKNTVRRHVTQIFQKLGVKNRMEAVVWFSYNRE